MKTLQQIIERNDYKKLTVVLKERVQELAVIIRGKMEDLEVYDLSSCKIIIARANGYSKPFLATKNSKSLEDINKNYYFCGDFYSKVEGANSKQAIAFLNSVKDILKELDEIENNKVNQIENALKNAEL